MKDYSKLKLLVIDVDGTLTDAGLYYSGDTILKKFSTRDMVGVMAAHYCNMETIVITGRESETNKRRLKEMKIDSIYQGIKSKRAFLQEYINSKSIACDGIAYIGDDLNDYGAIKLAGFAACPADSCDEIKEIADYVSSVKGGDGVLRDVMKHILIALNKWDDFLADIEKTGY